MWGERKHLIVFQKDFEDKVMQKNQKNMDKNYLNNSKKNLHNTTICIKHSF